MKIILKDKNVVVDVPDGYARNYLIPRGLAIVATTSEIKKLEENALLAKEEDRKKREDHLLSASKIDGKVITVFEKTGDGGRLFGSVTAKEVSQHLYSQLSIRIEKQNIELDSQIKEIGKYKVKVNFGMGVSATLTLIVKSTLEA